MLKFFPKCWALIIYSISQFLDFKTTCITHKNKNKYLTKTLNFTLKHMYFDKNCHDYSKLETIFHEVDDILYSHFCLIFFNLWFGACKFIFPTADVP